MKIRMMCVKIKQTGWPQSSYTGSIEAYFYFNVEHRTTNDGKRILPNRILKMNNITVRW